MSKSYAEAVQSEFTSVMLGGPCPEKPVALSKERVKFIVKNVMSEMHELVCTVTDNRKESLEFMTECLNDIDEHKYFSDYYLENIKKISAQADALVDAMYYMYDTGARNGINLSPVFELVHESNRTKVDVKNGAIRREDGKVMKPFGWLPADIDKEILRQTNNGSWSK